MSTQPIPQESPELMMCEDLGSFADDPLSAVMYGFPWGEGDLEDSHGPRKWQRDVLCAIRDHLQNPETKHQPCQIAVSSGHDIGKSSLLSMITWWALSTFEDCRVNITANTENQLKTKTSPELAKWFRLSINAAWFDKAVMSIKSNDGVHGETWRCDLVPWSEKNPAASAGLHNKGKRLLFICDEASQIPQMIFDVAEGVMLDEHTEIIWLVFGNPTHNSGPFYDAVFGKTRNRWKTFVIDSRDVEGTNKEKLKQWAEDYGEDSDFFRVRARGLAPRAASAQFIDMDLINRAKLATPYVLPDEPLVVGVDFAWGGADDNVVRFRRGLDARSIKAIKVKGEFTRDPAIMTNKLATILSSSHDGHRVAMMFVDSAGIAGPVVARLRQMGHQNVREVNFGADSPDMKAAYFRDYIWGQLKQWLIDGGAIDDDPELEADLSGPCLISDARQRLKLEPKELMKKRGVDSPDDGDALALTFAYPVAALVTDRHQEPPPRVGVWS